MAGIGFVGRHPHADIFKTVGKGLPTYLLQLFLKNFITVKRDILLMTIIEVNGHVVFDAEFGGFFQIIGDDYFAVFLEGDEAEIEDFVGVG